MHQKEGDKKCGNFSLLVLGGPHVTEKEKLVKTKQLCAIFLNKAN